MAYTNKYDSRIRKTSIDGSEIAKTDIVKFDQENGKDKPQAKT